MEWLELFPEPLHGILGRLPETVFKQLEEIRVREGRPLEINANGDHHFVTSAGRLTLNHVEAYKPDREDALDCWILSAIIPCIPWKRSFVKGLLRSLAVIVLAWQGEPCSTEDEWSI